MASSAKSKVYFFFDTTVNIKNRTKLKKFIEDIFRAEGKRLQYLNYIFCTDEQLLVINTQYLKHEYYTDIITFELSEKKDLIEGEIYISVERVRENSIVFEESVKKELHRVILHGALHLCGYRDKSTKEKRIMRGKENFYLSLYLKRST